MPSTTTDLINGGNTSAALKLPVRVATTANITLSGTQTIDGVSVVADDRVLVKNQTTSSENGIYVASASAWSRAKDFDGSRDAVTGTLVYIRSGTVAGDRFARLTSTNPVDIGTDNITWEIVAGPGLGSISAFAATLLDDPDAAAARLTLGINDGSLDITGLTALTAPAVGDELPIYDLSATANRKITLANLFKIIAALTAETSPATDDELAIYDTSAGTADKITLADMLKVLNSLTEDTSPDASADFVLTYDTSASSVKKAKPSNLGTGSMVLLGTLTASASATLDFTAFDSSLYGSYVFQIAGLYPATDATELRVRMSLDSGLNYRSTAGDYVYSLTASVQGSAVSLGSTGQTYIALTSTGATNGMENTAAKAYHATLTLNAPDGGNPVLQGTGAYTRTTDDGVFMTAVGARFKGTADAVNGIRFFMDSGNITAGTIRVYGVKK